jgi:hypothetical protein
MRIAIGLGAALLTCGCGGADEQQLDRVRELLGQICQLEAGDNGAFDGIDLHRAARPQQPVGPGTMVALTPAGVAIDGRPVVAAQQLLDETEVSRAILDALREQVQLERLVRQRNPAQPEKPLVLAISARAPARLVRIALETLFRLELRRVQLVFEPTAPRPVPPAPDRALFERLTGLPEDQVPLQGANKIAELAAGCPELARVFGAIGFVPPAERCSVMGKLLVEALASSSCETDVDQVLTVVHVMTVPRRPMTVVPAALHPDAPGIAAAPDAPWSQVAEAFLARGDGRLWIELTLPAADTQLDNHPVEETRGHARRVRPREDR